MKKFLLIVAVLSIVFCVLSLLYAALNLFAYHNVLDGSAELYRRLHQRTVIFSVIGIVLAAAGAVFLIIRSKI